MPNIFKNLILYFIFGSYFLMAQENKIKEKNPFENSFLINEYKYDAVFSVIQDSPENYIFTSAITPDSLKGRNPIPIFAQAWKNTIPITNNYKNRFFNFSQELDHELTYEINGIEVSKRYPTIRPKNKKYYQRENNEDDLKAIDKFDKDIKNGTDWIFKFVDSNNSKKNNDKTNFETSQKIHLNAFPEIIDLQKEYFFEKNKDLVITFPRVKNADVLHFEILCNNTFGCDAYAPQEYRVLGLIKAIDSKENSITIYSYELDLMGSDNYTLKVSAISATEEYLNNNLVLLQNISQNNTTIKLK